MPGIADAFLQQTIHKRRGEPFVAPDRQRFTVRGFERHRPVRDQVNVSGRPATPHLHPQIKGGAVIIEHADVDQSLAHGKFLVAVLATAADRRRHILCGQHGLESGDVRRALVGITATDDFRRARPLLGAPGGLHGAVGIFVAAGEHCRPGVHDVDGILGIRLVGGDIPEQRLGVGGGAVVLFIFATQIRCGKWSAITIGPRMRRI